MTKTGMRPIDQFAESDVFVAGYPKSGNTWMQYLVAGAFYGIDLRVAPDSVVQDSAPDVHFKKFYKPQVPVTFFKSHWLPRPEYRKVVYLLRDGRDVMVSYWHYLRDLCGEEIDFAKMVATGDKFFPCKWNEHVERWLENPHSAQMITVRYEDLKKDAVGELARIADFAGIKREVGALETAVRSASFPAMKRREALFPWESPQIPKSGRFVRRGEVGSHRDEMPRAALDAFMAEAAATLKRTGYLK
ncbi:MAG TPA: sulfotransferase domain-containing protein [Verrucomicrobiae bacterium]|jgi:hypothetical protein|nr:sulfotransferase domain-containing protein [Verrucomicrobiae bacterium]